MMHACIYYGRRDHRPIVFVGQIPNTTLTRWFDCGANPSLIMGALEKWMKSHNQIQEPSSPPFHLILSKGPKGSATRGPISKPPLLSIANNYKPLIDFRIPLILILQVIKCNKEVIYIGPPSFRSQLSSIEGSKIVHLRLNIEKC